MKPRTHRLVRRILGTVLIVLLLLLVPTVLRILGFTAQRLLLAWPLVLATAACLILLVWMRPRR